MVDETFNRDLIYLWSYSTIVSVFSLFHHDTEAFYKGVQDKKILISSLSQTFLNALLRYMCLIFEPNKIKDSEEASTLVHVFLEVKPIKDYKSER